MFAQAGVVESSAVGRWSETLAELHERIGHRFARSEARGRVKRYLIGLLGRVERKNGAGNSPRQSAKPTRRVSSVS